MYTYSVWVRLDPQGQRTAHVRIRADDGYTAKLIAESQYGPGNVLNYTQVND